jgi:hypothetical protein
MKTDSEQDTQETPKTVPNTQHGLTLNAEPKPMEPAGNETLLKQAKKDEESGSGTEDEEYKEDPFYYDKTPDDRTNKAQTEQDNKQHESSTSDPNLTSAKAQDDGTKPGPTTKVHQEFKRGGDMQFKMQLSNNYSVQLSKSRHFQLTQVRTRLDTIYERL